MSTRLGEQDEKEISAPKEKSENKSGATEKSSTFLPYNGDKTTLDDAKVSYSKDDKRTKHIKAGKPRYSIERNGNTFKLIAHYKNGKGVGRRLVRVMKPYKKTAIDDRAVMQQLYGLKIPGSVKI